MTQKSHSPNMFVQLVINLALPLIILTRYSDESELGPTKALLLALAFPVAYELYSIKRRRKVSMLSILAIGGILVTGAISLLGLSEGWLAIRRSVPYVAIALAILVSILIKRSLVGAVLRQIIDMDEVKKRVTKDGRQAELDQSLKTTGYLLVAVFMAIAIIAYVLTRVVIVSPTDTTGFNHEYARLRVLSLPFTMVPMFIGVVVVIAYVTSRLEKLTGIELEKLLKKKQ